MKHSSKLVWLVCALIVVCAVVGVVVRQRTRYWVPQGKFPPATRLMIAAREGNEARVLMYLEQGRDVNEANLLGYTAFTHAVINGHYDIARLLISRGANPKMQPDEEAIMIGSVADHGDDGFLVYLLEQVGIDFPCLDVLRAFAGYCQVEAIETLLRAMGDNAAWGVDEIRRFAQMETDCSEEIGLLVEKYGKK